MEEKQFEKQSSIKVSRNAKGQYSFEVKTYYNEDARESADVVEQNANTMGRLIEEFPNG